MTSKTKISLALLVAAAGVGVVSLVYFNREKPFFPSPLGDEARTSAESDAKRMAEADAQAADRFKREALAGGSAARSTAVPKPSLLDYGRVKGVPANLNHDTQVVAEALRTHTHPERVSVLHEATPLDVEAWRHDPLRVAAAYASIPEPGRVFQPAQPGEGVKPSQQVGEAYRKVLQSQPTDLTVRTLPLAPVSFTSFDLGQFGNGLTTQTVVADREGLATATFTAGPGTVQNVNILAASPVTSGQVKFLVWVKPPAAPLASR